MSKNKEDTRTYYLNGKLYEDITRSEYLSIMGLKKEVIKPKKEEPKKE